MSLIDLPEPAVWQLFDSLPYDDLVHLCQVSPEFRQHCQNSTYWRHRIRSEFRIPSFPTDTHQTYRWLSSCRDHRRDIRRCLESSRNSPGEQQRLLTFLVNDAIDRDLRERTSFLARATGMLNRPDLLNRIVQHFGPQVTIGPLRGGTGQGLTYRRLALAGTAEAGHQDLVFQLMGTDPIDLKIAIERAGRGRTKFIGEERSLKMSSYRDLINELARRGGRWTSVAYGAAQENRLDLLLGLIEEGKITLNQAAVAALDARDPQLTEEFIRRGANNFNQLLSLAVLYGNRELALSLATRGTINLSNLDSAIARARRRGHGQLADELSIIRQQRE